VKFRKNRHPHTLVINGKHYSASSGQALEQHDDKPAAPAQPAKHIDGLHKADGYTSAPQAPGTRPHAPKPVEKKPPSPRQVAVRSLDGPSHVASGQPAKRLSLGAHQLHKRTQIPPATPTRSRQPAAPAAKTRVTSPLPASAPVSPPRSTPAVVHGASEMKARAQRARRVARSSHIQKFVTASTVPALASPPVKATRETKPSNSTSVPKIENTHHRPPILSQYDLTPAPGSSKTKPHRRGNIIGHKARLASISALGLSVLLVGGYIAYLNAPNLAVRIAASRSGVEAALPGYNPSGYRYAGPISYRPGSVVVNFRSDSGQSYTIAQEESNWDSRSLLENVVAQRDGEYQTFQEKGLTVYIYNGSHAAWVNDGIRYSLEGTASLPPEQILRIAASI
jgi:hypothetical protein